MHFEKDDQWTVADLLSHLSFVRGELHFYADYVRCRMVKTSVYLQRDGILHLTTVNRGTSAERWVAMLKGRRHLSLVDSQEPEDEQGAP